MWLAGRDLNPQLLILENSALPLSYRLLNRSSTRRFGYCRGIVPRSSCETLAGRPGCAQSSQRAGSQGSDAGQCVITLSESPDLATRCYLVAGFHAAAKYEKPSGLAGFGMERDWRVELRVHQLGRLLRAPCACNLACLEANSGVEPDLIGFAIRCLAVRPIGHSFVASDTATSV